MTQQENQPRVPRDVLPPNRVTKSNVDYPAAHSMDSTWFAVDAEGNIAEFETGEAGAAPDSALIDQGSVDAERVAEMLSQSDYVLDFSDLIVTPDGNIYSPKSYASEKMVKYQPATGNRNEYNCLFWLKDESFFEKNYGKLPKKWLGIIQRVRAPMKFIRIPHPDAIFGFVETIPANVLIELQQEDAFHKCWTSFQFNPWRYGWYGYSHGDLFENWISGPYIKESQPKVPMKLEQLPEAMQREIGAVRMEQANFKTDRSIQPFEHAPSGGWQSQCIDSNGVTHDVENLPGK